MRALAKLGYRPRGTLLADLPEPAIQRWPKLSPYNVGSLCWGYATLGAHPGDALLQARPSFPNSLDAATAPAPSFTLLRPCSRESSVPTPSHSLLSCALLGGSTL